MKPNQWAQITRIFRYWLNQCKSNNKSNCNRNNKSNNNCKSQNSNNKSSSCQSQSNSNNNSKSNIMVQTKYIKRTIDASWTTSAKWASICFARRIDSVLRVSHSCKPSNLLVTSDRSALGEQNSRVKMATPKFRTNKFRIFYIRALSEMRLDSR